MPPKSPPPHIWGRNHRRPGIAQRQRSPRACTRGHRCHTSATPDTDKNQSVQCGLFRGLAGTTPFGPPRRGGSALAQNLRATDHPERSAAKLGQLDTALRRFSRRATGCMVPVTVPARSVSNSSGTTHAKVIALFVDTRLILADPGGCLRGAAPTARRGLESAPNHAQREVLQQAFGARSAKTSQGGADTAAPHAYSQPAG